MRDMLMEIPMKETLTQVKLTERESILGLMVKFMMENGSKGLKKAMECGEASLEIATWVSGRIAKLMAMEFISGRMGIDMRDPGSIVSSMAKARIFLQMEMSTLVITKMENQMAKVSTSGKMEVFTKVNSKMV